MKVHPGTITSYAKKFKKQNFARHFEWAIDESVSRRDGDGDSNDNDVVFGCWTEFGDKSGGEKMEADTLGMFLDMTMSPILLTGALDRERAENDM